uniref:Uncharacterized protein n=1 Tax=Nonomuraea gerenzanensis TaxID=93944 RepID=A0A1M4EL36_9ACTN|nr:hypothetical protein BN4615_P8984 [Nonomuraea gerenzanensis]
MRVSQVCAICHPCTLNRGIKSGSRILLPVDGPLCGGRGLEARF